jgi:glycosyltransferase involved in cell wall biosynthesis
MLNNKKPKILCVMQLPPPIHGAAVMNSIVANSELLKDNFEIDVLSTNYVKTTKEIGSKSFRKIYLLIKYLWTLTFKLLFNRPNLVYFTIVPYGMSFYRDAIFVTIIKLFRVKLVYHLHGKGANNNYKRNKWIYDFVYGNVSVICLTERLKEDISFYNGEPFVLNNGIPEVEYTAIQKSSDNDGIVRILYLSNFIKSKGVFVLLDAVKVLKGMCDHFKIQLIGQYRGKISKTFLELYLKDNEISEFVEIVGPKFGKSKETYFLNADIFVFPTYYRNETFGLVNLEAMQYNLPIIATNEGGISEVVLNDKTGFIVKPKDVRELADKLLFLISNKNIRDQMGVEGRNRYKEKFTVSIFEEKLNKILKLIMKQ